MRCGGRALERGAQSNVPNNGWSNSSSDVVWFRNSDNRSGVDSKILNAMQDGTLKRFDSVVNTTSGFIQGVELENSKYVRRAYLGVPYVVVFENINSHHHLLIKNARTQIRGTSKTLEASQFCRSQVWRFCCKRNRQRLFRKGGSWH